MEKVPFTNVGENLVFINFTVIVNKPTGEPDWRWATY